MYSPVQRIGLALLGIAAILVLVAYTNDVRPLFTVAPAAAVAGVVAVVVGRKSKAKKEVAN